MASTNKCILKIVDNIYCLYFVVVVQDAVNSVQNRNFEPIFLLPVHFANIGQQTFKKIQLRFINIIVNPFSFAAFVFTIRFPLTFATSIFFTNLRLVVIFI